ncbi:prepilin-type N-terminal cleavage/methylation domain-containing protein [Candidatus Microgenomates bacterium]|nr:prepilin-type N-terminal cleavage/methylation domain-containing protein [Candidatus Microgenomates bacterium]
MRKNCGTCGFTLIELIVVVSILTVLSTLGIAAFINYSRTQALNEAVSDVATMLQTAKKVVICPGGCPAGAAAYDYALNAVCAGNDELIEEKILPSGICFGLCASIRSFSEESFFFPVLTGGAVVAVDGISGPSVRILIGHRDFTRVPQLKFIRVYSDGRILSN